LFASQLTAARLNPATPPSAVLANLEANYNAVLAAFNENRGRPSCSIRTRPPCGSALTGNTRL
jgi:hypothetical protein